MKRAFSYVFNVLLVVGTGAPIFTSVLFWHSTLTERVSTWLIVLVVIFVALSLVPVLNALLVGNQNSPGVFVFAGLKSVYNTGSQAMPTINRKIARAKESVKLIDTYLGPFDNLQDSISHAVANGCKIQILTAEKRGRLAEIRGAFTYETINENLGALKARIDDFKRQLREKKPGTEPSIELRSYDRVVPGPMFIIDDRFVFVGTFLQQTGSQNSPLLELDCGRLWSKGVPRAYIETFDSIWRSSAT